MNRALSTFSWLLGFAGSALACSPSHESTTSATGGSAGEGGSAGASIGDAAITDGGNPSGACWGLTQPLPNPTTTEEYACNALINSDLGNLASIFGGYATKSIAGYHGTVDAYDNRDVLPGYDKMTLSGSANAQLIRTDPESSDPPAWKLQITVPGSQRWLQVIQYDSDPSTLVVSDISEWCCSEGGPLATSLAGGIVLGDGEASLSLVLDASGGEWGAGEPKTIHLSLDMTRIAGNALPATWAIDFGHPAAWDFQVEGDELVRHRTHWGISYATESPPQMQGWGCGWSTDYSLDQWVNIENPASYGVRNVTLHSAEMCCATDCYLETCAKTVCCVEQSECQPR